MKPVLWMLGLAACGGRGAAHETTPSPAPVKSIQLNTTGAAVNVESNLVAGYVTVVDFWADYCGACEVVGAMLDHSTATQPRVVIRKVDVGDGDSPVAKAYQIGSLPHFNVYDKHGRLRYSLVGNDTTKAGDLAAQLAAED